jgi:hypothetical protein
MLGLPSGAIRQRSDLGKSVIWWIWAECNPVQVFDQCSTRRYREIDSSHMLATNQPDELTGLPLELA